ncbi:pilus assembly protein [Pseudocitrobacter sp. RIT415]|uniref:Toxin co-regulated pilus biosynthesis protein Q n=1 Tax=Pseudocitrobacter faecalis TaxID=1398493 RepID=A0ABX9FRA2_9ENTR|nr:TcpQ domain-containing protein [Pseudocitrobacter sp. RIT 415]RAU51595.1 pilus assembly protein [Pseudocitrobacter sp. RIT 415]RBP08340.1 toxin co-regulated pilus biosynthesis protein Q [Pseudocitrobacter faecalis]
MKKLRFYGYITLLVLGTSSALAATGGTTSATPQATVRNPFQGGSVSTGASSTIAPSLVLHENELLSQGVKKWVEGNGYKLFWNSKKDYLIYNDITLSGRSDDEILQQLGELFFSENYGLVVKKYEKNRVIVIDEL